MTSSPALDRDGRIRATFHRARLLVNRTPHLSPATRKEANRAIDRLEDQLGRNQVNPVESASAFELINRAHASIAFGLLRDHDVAERFAGALRQLGLRGISDRLDEVPGSVMAQPIPGPIDGRRHRDELPTEERVDAEGRPLPPPPGFY